MKLEKIISGGQTGVDQAALRAARRSSIATGGWAPRCWMTLVGPQKELLSGFGLVEHEGGYAARTEANVRDSDVTLRIASNFKSPGEKLTKLCTFKYGKPRFDVFVDVKFGVEQFRELRFQTLLTFLQRYNVRALNVAGNSEQTSPGIGAVAEEFLVAVFRALNLP